MVGAAGLPFSWLSGNVVALAGMVLISVGLTALVVIFASTWHRERRIGRGIARTQTALHADGHPTAKSELTDRQKAFVAAEEVHPDALGWQPAETARRAAPSRPQEVEASTATAVAAKTILVADDDPVVTFSLKRRLEQLGFQVVRSPDSAHALVGAMKLEPDLVILDVNMPGGNGLAVCEMMASDPRYANIPVIVHTSRIEESIKKRCEKLGARYVEKSPKSWAEISEVVTAILGESQAETAEPSSDEARCMTPVCGRPRVVCIDGVKGELEGLQKILVELGVEVSRVNDLEAGFWTCFTEKPHAVVILTDVRGKPLQEAVYRFVQHPVTRSLPVFLLLDAPLTAKETAEWPYAESVKILDASIGSAGVVLELEKIIPIAAAEDSVSLAVPSHHEEPTIDQADQAVAAEPLARLRADEKPLKILCIDDDPLIAKSIGMRLKPYGIEVQGADSGTKGFFLGLRELPDLILLDLHMPDGEGDYILGRLKNHPRTKDIPVVMLTVETNPGVERKMTCGGAVGFLSKPVRWNAFFAELQRHVRLPHQLLADYKVQEELD